MIFEKLVFWLDQEEKHKRQIQNTIRADLEKLNNTEPNNEKQKS